MFLGYQGLCVLGTRIGLDNNVLPEDGGLIQALPLTVHLNLFLQTSKGDHSETFLLSELFCGTPPSWLKVIGGVVGLLVGWVGGCGGSDGWPLIFLCQPLAF